VLYFPFEPIFVETLPRPFLEQPAQVFRAQADKGGGFLQAHLLVIIALDERLDPRDLARRSLRVEGSRAASLEQKPDDLSRLLVIDRFLDVIIGVALEGFDCDVLRAVTGQDDHGQARRDALHFLEHPRAAHIGQLDVEYDEIDLIRLRDDIERFPAVLCLDKMVVVKELSELLPEFVVVVDEQDIVRHVRFPARKGLRGRRAVPH